MKRLLRIRRLIEYVGEPDAVLEQLSKSMKEGEHVFPRGPKPEYRITVSQLGNPEMVNGDSWTCVAANPEPSEAKFDGGVNDDSRK